ncbi:hypothetical protein QEG98_10150 [Myxococcus sp. MxC21-1]|uniref:hypothetical protein n=1 Tax=Myxococcus sp. MxC21-1 TaxID=3041439 RepID=UPI002931AD1A|nr:hypothetical protein [Myxococcus sp. MxC21-1]WNZ64014.1 hypothetical protein QEG98_10150 [Myxococcus sp. MxC21-1]
MEQEGRSGVLATQEEPEAAPPEPDVEDGLLEGLALLSGQGAVVTQSTVEHALGGGAGEHLGDGIGRHGAQAVERGPGLEVKPGERIKRDC